MITVRAALAAGAARLAGRVDDPRREARLLLADALGLTVERLILGPDIALPQPAAVRFESHLARRASAEPLAYLTGRREFWSLSFAVSPATLIPRPDTETLIEAAIAARPDRRAVMRILDLGTGTGCLLCAALSEFPEATGLGVDRSLEAASLARRNAESLGLSSRSAFVVGEWGTALRGGFDLVLSNPPYIPTAEIPGLMAEVARHEPGSALDGGPDGLAAYRAILADLPRLLAPGGLAILELGLGQAEEVARIARAEGLAVAGLRHDLTDIPRAILLGVETPLAAGAEAR